MELQNILLIFLLSVNLQTLAYISGIRYLNYRPCLNLPSRNLHALMLDTESTDFLQPRKISDVIIEAPSMNSRRITASIILDCPQEDVWAILSDYNNLAKHVPNLIKSYLVPHPTNPKGIRLFQEGAQKIVGFDFRASLTMDMTEEESDENSSKREKYLRFTLIDSAMFSAFEGSWILKNHSRKRVFDPIIGQYVYTYTTLLTYTVLVRPKGLVPVMALEWRIREDVPTNLKAVKIAAERLNRNKANQQTSANLDAWAADETLGMYIATQQKLEYAATTTNSASTISSISSASISSTTASSNGNSTSNSNQKQEDTIISRIFQNILSRNN